MLMMQALDIIILATIRGAEYPFVVTGDLLHTTVPQDTLHINAGGVA
jgi:hypothetical protein